MSVISAIILITLIKKKKRKTKKNKDNKAIKKHKNNNKLTYKLEFELKNLPNKIENLRIEKEKIEKIFTSENSIKNGIDPELTKRHNEIINEIEANEERWIELETMKEDCAS